MGAALAAEFVETLEANGGGLVYWRDNPYIFGDGIWRRLDEKALGQEIMQWLGTADEPQVVEARDIGDMLGWLRYRAYLDSRLVPPVWIDGEAAVAAVDVLVLTNGILDCGPLRRGEDPQLLEHTPRLFVLARADYDYDPTAKAPKFEAWLRWFASGNEGVARLLLQYIGYAIMSSLEFQRFMVLLGTSANNGKSTFLELVQNVLGTDNVSALTLGQLHKQFAKVRLVGKLLNASPELKELGGVEEDHLKSLVDGSEHDVEEKFKANYKTVFTARQLFACNRLPHFHDRSGGLWRRLMVVPCLAEVKSKERIQKFHELFNGELAGILNMVLQATKGLKDRSDFEIPAEVQDCVAQHREDANPTRLFLEGHLVEDSDGHVDLDDLYTEYRVVMCENGHAKGVMSKPTLGRELGCVFPNRVKRKLGPRKCRGTVYKGVAWREGCGPNQKTKVVLRAPPTKAKEPEREKELRQADEKPDGMIVADRPLPRKGQLATKYQDAQPGAESPAQATTATATEPAVTRTPLPDCIQEEIDAVSRALSGPAHDPRAEEFEQMVAEVEREEAVRNSSGTTTVPQEVVVSSGS